MPWAFFSPALSAAMCFCKGVPVTVLKTMLIKPCTVMAQQQTPLPVATALLVTHVPLMRVLSAEEDSMWSKPVYSQLKNTTTKGFGLA